MTDRELLELLLQKVLDMDNNQQTMQSNIQAMQSDIADVKSNMATKDDIAELPYIRQAVLENSRELVRLSEAMNQVSNTVTRIEHEHGEKLSTLFDGHQLYAEQLNRIEDKVGTHEEIIFKRIK